MSYGVGHRHSSDPVWLWLWCRPAATAPIRPLAWELPYATGMALKRRKKERKKETNKWRSSHPGSVEMNLTSILMDAGSIPGLAQWVNDLALP